MLKTNYIFEINFDWLPGNHCPLLYVDAEHLKKTKKSEVFLKMLTV